MAHSGLLVDFGGVLTTSVFGSFAAFCEAEGIDPDSVRRAFAENAEARRLLFDLELGHLDPAAFGIAFGALLDIRQTDGLVARLFAGMRPETAMIDAVRAFRAGGVRTGLISNSWGEAGYDRALFAQLFDGMVISAEEGIRKPDPAIYALGAQRIGLAPEQCVFVDDLPGNLKPARALGMATIHHTDPARTIAWLEQLLAVRSSAAGPPSA